MNIASRGATMSVDWEQRVNFDRLRSARLERTKAALRATLTGDGSASRASLADVAFTLSATRRREKARGPLRASFPRGLATSPGSWEGFWY